VTIKWSHLELFCHDTNVAARWWQHALDATLDTDMGEFKFMTVQGLTLLLRPGVPGSAANYRSADLAIVFCTDDLAAAAQILTERGIEFGHGDEDACLTLQDSEGHWIQITDQVMS
jgi:hypothetical protein